MAQRRKIRKTAVLGTRRRKVKARMTRAQWEEFLRDLSDRVIDAVHYWCWNVGPDTPASCFSTHALYGLWELANEFVGYTYGISEEDIKLLEKAPEDLYDKYSQKVSEHFEAEADRLCNKYGCDEEW